MMVWEGYTDTLFTKPFEEACGVKVNAAATVIFALSVVIIVLWARLMREDAV